MTTGLTELVGLACARRPPNSDIVASLAVQLARVDPRDETANRAALAALAAAPRAVIRLDYHARRTVWYTPTVQHVVKQFKRGRAGAAGLALLSTHRDGHLREASVEAMLARFQPGFVPFVLMRSGDRVEQVSLRARTGVAAAFAADPQGWLAAALPFSVLTHGRSRFRFLLSQVTAALLTAPEPLREWLAASPEPDIRRFTFALGLRHGWWDQERLARFAVSDPDIRLRVPAAEAVCREALWSRRPALPRRLAGDGRTQSRTIALSTLARLGFHDEVGSHLDDRNPLVRGLARESARHNGIDVHRHYREAVAQAHPPVGAIAGLAETARPEQASILLPLLTHGSGKIRAQAVRALTQLRAYAPQLLDLLRDPSPAVVREAGIALRGFDGMVPQPLPWQLLEDARPEVRRAGYGLLAGRSEVQRLKGALILAHDGDPVLARLGADHAIRISGGLGPPDFTPDEKAELTRLTVQAAASLGEQTVALLRQRLSGSRR